MMSALFKSTLLLALAMAWAVARADIYVIVNANNAMRPLTNKEAIDLFMGRTRTFPNGDYVLACDLQRDHASRVRFYQSLTGMTQAQLNSYWSRLMFTGQVMPPQTIGSEAAMLEMVRRNPGAIGYVGQEPQDKGVRVVLTIKTGL
jgi:ABC-type phosphate transport system substrate-binding protein